MTTRALENILSDLGVVPIACNETGGPMRTRAVNVMRRVLDEYGEGHLILVLRTITESDGNAAMLTEPVLRGVSEILLAHPQWGDRGLAWIEAFDDISLKELATIAKANRRAATKSAAIATMLYERLAPSFAPTKTKRTYRRQIAEARA